MGCLVGLDSTPEASGGLSDMGIAEEKNPEYRAAGDEGWFSSAVLSLFEDCMTSARNGESRLSLGRLGKVSVLDCPGSTDVADALLTWCNT